VGSREGEEAGRGDPATRPSTRPGWSGTSERDGKASGCTSVGCPVVLPAPELPRGSMGCRLSRAFRDAASLLGLVGRAKAGRTERLELAGAVEIHPRLGCTYYGPYSLSLSDQGFYNPVLFLGCRSLAASD